MMQFKWAAEEAKEVIVEGLPPKTTREGFFTLYVRGSMPAKAFLDSLYDRVNRHTLAFGNYTFNAETIYFRQPVLEKTYGKLTLPVSCVIPQSGGFFAWNHYWHTDEKCFKHLQKSEGHSVFEYIEKVEGWNELLAAAA